MIPKSGNRFSEKITLHNKLERDDDSKKSHPALALISNAAHAQVPAQMRPGIEAPNAAATTIIHNTELAGGNVSHAPGGEHSGQFSNFLINTVGQPRMEWNHV